MSFLCLRLSLFPFLFFSFWLLNGPPGTSGTLGFPMMENSTAILLSPFRCYLDICLASCIRFPVFFPSCSRSRGVCSCFVFSFPVSVGSLLHLSENRLRGCVVILCSFMGLLVHMSLLESRVFSLLFISLSLFFLLASEVVSRTERTLFHSIELQGIKSLTL